MQQYKVNLDNIKDDLHYIDRHLKTLKQQSEKWLECFNHEAHAVQYRSLCLSLSKSQELLFDIKSLIEYFEKQETIKLTKARERAKMMDSGRGIHI